MSDLFANIERLIAEHQKVPCRSGAPRAKNRLVILVVDQARSAGVESVGFTVDAT